MLTDFRPTAFIPF